MDDGSTLNLAHMVRPARSYDKGKTAGDPVPGLLLLHGRGADEADLMGLEPALDARLTIISARAPFRLGPGFAWYAMEQVGVPDPETFNASLEDLTEFIEGMVPAYGLDPERIFVMGFSQGAVMSAAMALLMPDRLRGAIVHSGYVPVPAGDSSKLEAARDKPFFVAHGRYDEVIPVTFGREARDLLTAAGARLTYQEYPMGHGISEESLFDLGEWLTAEVEDSAH